jgi:hypothetical protein
MSASRQKDQADFDLETFVDLFDTAMSSDNPAVQRALKNLLLIAAMVNSENTDAGLRQGPLRRVIEDQKNILRRLERVENEKSYPQPGTYGPVPIPNQPTPWPGPAIGPTWPSPVTNPGMVPPGTIWTTNTSGAIAGASTTAHEDQFKSYNTLFEKLESKQ